MSLSLSVSLSIVYIYIYIYIYIYTDKLASALLLGRWSSAARWGTSRPPRMAAR